MDFIFATSGLIVSLGIPSILACILIASIYYRSPPFRKIAQQWLKFLSAVGLLIAGAWLGIHYAVIGGLTNTLISLTIVGGLAGYGVKIRRAHANVRYRVAKVLETGDGGSDYYSVLLRVRITPFITLPWDHFRKPFPADELTIPHAGLNAGSCRMNTRPVSNVEKGVRVFDIGDFEKAPSSNAGEQLQALRDLGSVLGLDMQQAIADNMNYSDLPAPVTITRSFFYKWMGLEILVRDGLKM